jgi:hypothetical protein
MAAAPWDATRQATAIQLVLDAAADVGASDVTAQVSCLPLQYTCSDSHSTTIVVTANASVSDPTHFLIGDGMGVAAASAVRHAH